MIKYFYITVVFVLLSCESKTDYKKPADLIPKEQMINILMDMHLVNGISGVKSKEKIKTGDYMSVLYKKYQVDSGRFAASNLYYISNINEYEEMLEEVEKRLETQQVLFEDDSIIIPEQMRKGRKLKIPSKIKRKKDSILK